MHAVTVAAIERFVKVLEVATITSGPGCDLEVAMRMEEL
jgi:hypothetical protein